MTTRTRAKKPTSRKPVRKAPAAGMAKLPTRKPLAQRDFMTAIQIDAAFTAGLAGVSYTRITGWEHQADGTALYDFPNGAALTPCAHGSHHPHPVTTPQDLRDAQHQAASCTGHPTTDQTDPQEHPHD